MTVREKINLIKKTKIYRLVLDNELKGLRLSMYNDATEQLEYYDFIIYVDADPDVRISRRIIRDMKLRGRSLESIVEQYLTSVKPMHIKYVEPHKVDADFIYNNNSNNGIDEKQMQMILKHLVARR